MNNYSFKTDSSITKWFQFVITQQTRDKIDYSREDERHFIFLKPVNGIFLIKEKQTKNQMNAHVTSLRAVGTLTSGTIVFPIAALLAAWHACLLCWAPNLPASSLHLRSVCSACRSLASLGLWEVDRWTCRRRKEDESSIEEERKARLGHLSVGDLGLLLTGLCGFFFHVDFLSQFWTLAQKFPIPKSWFYNCLLPLDRVRTFCKCMYGEYFKEGSWGIHDPNCGRGGMSPSRHTTRSALNPIILFCSTF